LVYSRPVGRSKQAASQFAGAAKGERKMSRTPDKEQSLRPTPVDDPLAKLIEGSADEVEPSAAQPRDDRDALILERDQDQPSKDRDQDQPSKDKA